MSILIDATTRVIYDVNVESGHWTLQQAGDFKSSAPEPGKGADRKCGQKIHRFIHVIHETDAQRLLRWNHFPG